MIIKEIFPLSIFGNVRRDHHQFKKFNCKVASQWKELVKTIVTFHGNPLNCNLKI